MATGTLKQTGRSILASAALVAILHGNGAAALGLGDIQIDSHLGDPLQAQIEVLEPGDLPMQEIRVRQAGSEEYARAGLIYPGDIKFSFKAERAPDGRILVHIATRTLVEEPFISLLLELSVPNARFVKGYTFLLDPRPGWTNMPLVAQERGENDAQFRQPVQASPGEMKGDTAQSIQQAGVSGAPTKPPVRKHKKPPRALALAVADADTGRGTKVMANMFAPQTKSAPLFGKLSMSLSTSLIISRDEQGQAAPQRMSNDALQEELIAKQKTLDELNLQIAEMQAVIKSLHERLGNVPPASSMEQAPGADVPSSIRKVADAEPKPKKKIKVKALHQDEQVSSLSGYWSEAGLLLALAGAGGLVWYRRRRPQVPDEMVGYFDEPTAPPPPVEAVPLPSLQPELKLGSQTLKAPVSESQQTESLHPELDLLEEADVYLRFGHDKLAQDVLLDAIKLNPSNPKGYLALLGIYESRGDVRAFRALAERFKASSDEESWNKVCAMGRRLDADDPLYMAEGASVIEPPAEWKFRSELDEIAQLVKHDDDPFRHDPGGKKGM